MKVVKVHIELNERGVVKLQIALQTCVAVRRTMQLQLTPYKKMLLLHWFGRIFAKPRRERPFYLSLTAESSGAGNYKYMAQPYKF